MSQKKGWFGIMNKRKKTTERIESRIKKYEDKIPNDTVFDEGTAIADAKASMKIDQKLAKEWINQPSMAGKKRAGTVNDLKYAFRKICQSIGSTEWHVFVKAINNKDEINHMYASKTDPINIHDFKLTGDPSDPKEYSLTYETRDNQLKSSLVSSIRSTLSKIKKENNL